MELETHFFRSAPSKTVIFRLPCIMRQTRGLSQRSPRMPRWPGQTRLAGSVATWASSPASRSSAALSSSTGWCSRHEIGICMPFFLLHIFMIPLTGCLPYERHGWFLNFRRIWQHTFSTREKCWRTKAAPYKMVSGNDSEQLFGVHYYEQLYCRSPSTWKILRYPQYLKQLLSTVAV